MNTITLNPTQHAILAHAIHHTAGRIDWFPDNVKGGARQKVLQGLFNRALITPDGPDWRVAAEGYDALGCARPACTDAAVDPDLEAAVTQAEAAWSGFKERMLDDTDISEPATDRATGCAEGDAGTELPDAFIDAPQGEPAPTVSPVSAVPPSPVRTREHSKQATIVAMLKRTEGATIAQICEATGWLPHTVRGTFAGALKKKLGLAITSAKPQGGVRVYRAQI